MGTNLLLFSQSYIYVEIEKELIAKVKKERRYFMLKQLAQRVFYMPHYSETDRPTLGLFAEITSV